MEGTAHLLDLIDSEFNSALKYRRDKRNLGYFNLFVLFTILMQFVILGKLMILLRDGRTLIGYLRSCDQFANLVLHKAIGLLISINFKSK